MDGNMNNGYTQQTNQGDPQVNISKGTNYGGQQMNQGYGQQMNQGFGQNMNQGYGQPIHQNFGGPVGYTESTQSKAPEYTLWLVVGIILTVLGCCCCCGGGVTVPVVGILLIIFSSLGNSAYKEGRMVDYQKWFKWCKITIIVGTVLIVLNIIIGIIGGFTGMFTEIMDEFMYY